MMYEQILVPTDGSETAVEALDRAVEFAERNDAELHLLNVIDEMPSTRNPGMIEKKQQKQKAEADQMLEEMRSELDTDVTIHNAVRLGRPDEVIVSYAENNDLDLILMGRHGHSGLDRLLLGSTTERVLRSSSLPVMVIPPVESESA